MMEKIKKKILPLVVAGSMAAGSLFCGNPAIAEEEKTFNPRAQTALSRMETRDGGENRAEILVSNLPLNSDILAYFQDSEDGHFNKYRAQVVPLKKEIGRASVGLGAFAQHVNSSFADPDNQYGLVGRIQGKPTEKTFGKIDARYLPEEKALEAYGFLDSERLFIDVLGGYNLESRNAYAVPGVDLKLHKNFSLGVEAGFSGKDNLEKDYIGLRAKLHF